MCEEYREMISQAIDDELSAEQRSALEEHLSHCQDCRRYYQAMLAVSQALREVETPAVDLTGRIMAALPHEGRKRRPTQFYLLRAASLAASLLLFIGLGVFATRLFGDKGSARSNDVMMLNTGTTAESAEASEDAEMYDEVVVGVESAARAPDATGGGDMMTNAALSPEAMAAANALAYVEEKLPDELPLLLAPDAPVVTELDDTPPDYTPVDELYTPDGSGWQVSYATADGALTLLVDESGTVYGRVE